MSSGENSGYQVQLPVFQGPLDLLLYLIKNKELEIEEVSISLITSDFIKYVEKYRSLGHTHLAEFLAMAATLLYIKSTSILPLANEAELEEDMEDPRKALVYQLIEYEKVKKMMAFLNGKQEQYLLYRKSSGFLDQLKERIAYREIDFKELLDYYLKFFRPMKGTEMIMGKVRNVVSSVEDKIKWLARILKKKAVMSFFKLARDLARPERIITFLATLEMAKQDRAFLYQNVLFGDIIIENEKRSKDGRQEEIA
jgi:segregation and condensation protein A